MTRLDVLRWVLAHPRQALGAAWAAVRQEAEDCAAARLVLRRLVAEMRRERARGCN